MSKRDIPTRLNGVMYKSMAEAARANGLSYQALWVAFDTGNFKGLGIGKGRGSSVVIEHNGDVYHSIVSFCRKFDLPISTIQKKLSYARLEGKDTLETDVGEIRYLGKYRDIFGPGRWSPN